MLRDFINRLEELRILEKKYKEGKFNFVVIYGRRRVGKTELIRQFLVGKENIYFLADKRGTESNLERFKESLAEFLKEPKVELDTFDRLFKYLVNKIKNKKLILVIDEFSYLVEKDDSIPSVFQLIIDEILKDTNIYFIILGSSISMMEKGVLSYKSPLYGRRTGQLRINPLAFKEFIKFFPNYDLLQNIEAYSVFGGIPFYLKDVDDKINIFENIRNLVLDKGQILHEEVDFLLKEELRDPDKYKSILEAITLGCSRVVEIANKAGIDAKDLDKYLKVLIKLNYVKKEIPATEKLKSKKTIYHISDNFFNFWFRFCYKRMSDMEIGRIDKVLNEIKKDFNSYVGCIFENICRELISNIFESTKMGRWWHKDKEIDIIALNDKTREILFAECKWQNNVNPMEILNKLSEKSGFVEWNKENRKEKYAIFAKSFAKKIDKFEGRAVYCHDLKDIKSFLSKK